MYGRWKAYIASSNGKGRMIEKKGNSGLAAVNRSTAGAPPAMAPREPLKRC